jgi:tol-pal system protein YbgF
MSALREDNHRLNQTVSELRDSHRSDERKLTDLEHQLDELRAKQVSRTLGEVPSLPVEVVAPPASAQSSTSPRVVAVADDGSEIVYEGDAAAGKVAVADDDVVEQAPPPPKPRASEPAPRAVEPVKDPAPVTRHARRAKAQPHADAAPDRPADGAADEYRAAVEMLKAGKHEEAITALRAFLAHYPHHDYADNAQYWLGEAYYVQKEYQRALVEFRATIETYPRGNKVPDALLKVGYCYQALGQSDRARAVLEQVVNLYPKTEPAALAAKRLEPK